MMVKATMTERSFNLVVPLAHSAMNRLSAYRDAMNAIHEREI